MSSTNDEAQHYAVFFSHLLLRSSRFTALAVTCTSAPVSCSTGSPGLRPFSSPNVQQGAMTLRDAVCLWCKQMWGHTNTAQPACITQNAAARSESTERLDETSHWSQKASLFSAWSKYKVQSTKYKLMFRIS